MTDFEKTYQNYNPRQAALDEARALLTAAAKAAMADGTLPEAELPAFIVEIPADVKNGDIASTSGAYKIKDLEGQVELDAAFTFSCQAEMIIFELSLRSLG